MLVALEDRLKVAATISGIRRPTLGSTLKQGGQEEESAFSEADVRIIPRPARLMPQIGHQQYHRLLYESLLAQALVT